MVALAGVTPYRPQSYIWRSLAQDAHFEFPLSVAPCHPAASMPPKRPASSEKVYTIVVDQSDGTRLGIDVDKPEHLRMIVKNVNGGLIGEWNKTHPAMKVERGHQVVQVNDVKCNGTYIVELDADLTMDQPLTIQFKPVVRQGSSRLTKSQHVDHDNAKLQVRLMVRDLMDLNANWGGADEYRTKTEKLRKKIDRGALDPTLKTRIWPWLDKMNTHFQTRTPASHRMFMPNTLHILGESQTDIDNICKKHKMHGFDSLIRFVDSIH